MHRPHRHCLTHMQVRAKTFYADKASLSVSDVDVPVIGGHAGITILPLFSQASPDANLSDEQIDQLTKRTQDGGTEVVQAKAGKASRSHVSTSPLHVASDTIAHGYDSAPMARPGM